MVTGASRHCRNEPGKKVCGLSWLQHNPDNELYALSYTYGWTQPCPWPSSHEAFVFQELADWWPWSLDVYPGSGLSKAQCEAPL
jgi:hypothetical protein